MPAAAGRLDPSRHPGLARGIPLAWGFAEATLFFVLPEMWITWVALHGLRQGMAAAAWVLAAALAGGIAVHLAAHWNQMAVLALMERIPGVDAPLIMRAYDQLERHGWAGLLQGALGGVPWKLYATVAAGLDFGLPVFVVATAVARGLRFALFALAAWLVARWCLPRIGMVRLRLLWLAAWIAGCALHWA